MKTTIAIGCDHAGYEYKEAIINALEEKNIVCLDKGTDSLESVDYPDFIHPVADAIEAGLGQPYAGTMSWHH